MSARLREVRGVAAACWAMLLLLLLLAGPSWAAGPATAPSSASGGQANGAATQIVVSGLDPGGGINLLVNKSRDITTNRPYKRVSIGQPDIADVNGISPQRILVTARKPGTTQLIVWDEQENAQAVDITVLADAQGLRGLVQKLFPGSKVDVVVNDQAVVLTGHVPSATAADQVQALASGYGTKVINLLEVAGGQQVMLQVRLAEVSRSASSALGVNLAFLDKASGAFAASNVGQVNPFALVQGANGASQLADSAVTPTVTLFGRAEAGTTSIDAFVTALRQNNLLRILAEPNLVATSGQEASFLAGGEYPIPVTQGGGNLTGGVAITIEYKEFGVRLSFVPVVLGDGRIRMKVAPEVSDLDYTTAVRFNGFVIPGLSTRRVATTVELVEGQTFAVAGLLNNSVAASKDVTPLLGDIPVIGTLFRSVRYQRKETELVVLVTPRLVAGMNPGEVPTLPGEKWRNPTEGELFLNQDLGGPEGQDRIDPAKEAAPRPFIGNYGLVPPPEQAAQ